MSPEPQILIDNRALRVRVMELETELAEALEDVEVLRAGAWETVQRAAAAEARIEAALVALASEPRPTSDAIQAFLAETPRETTLEAGAILGAVRSAVDSTQQTAKERLAVIRRAVNLSG